MIGRLFNNKFLFDKIRANTELFIAFLVLFISVCVYYEYIFGPRIFIFTDTGSDTQNLYLPLIKMKQHLLENFSFYTFTWGIGENIFKNRFLFDLFSMPQMFMNDELLLKSFVYVMIAKHILASVLFYKFLETYNYTRFAKIIVSLIFGYIGFMVIWGQHYMFSSSVVYFMVALWGFERWLVQNKYLLFIFSVAYLLMFSLVTSFYFFIFLIFYATVRYIYIYDFKTLGLFFFKTFILGIISFLVSSIVVIPTLMAYLSSPRISGGIFDPSMFFSMVPFELNHILTTLLRFFSNDVMGEMNTYHLNVPFCNFYEIGNLYSGLLSIFLLPLVFLNTSKKEKILFSILIVIIYLFLNNQLFILLMSGYSKPYEFRYGFLFSIILLIALGKSISHIQKHGFPSVSIYLIVPMITIPSITLYVGVHYMHWGINFLSIIKFYILLIAFLSIYTYLLKSNINERYLQFVFILVTMCELIIFSYPTVNHRLTLNKDIIIKKGSYFDDTSKAISYLKRTDKEPFYRILKNYVSVGRNDAVYQKYFGLNSYSSLLNEGYFKLFKRVQKLPGSTGLRVLSSIQNMYLNSILSTKYILSKTLLKESFFLTFIKKIDSVYIYRNKKYIPFGVLHTKYMMESSVPKDSYALEEVLYSKLIIKKPFFPLPKEQESIDIDLKKEMSSYSGMSNLKIYKDNSFDFTTITNDPMITFNLKTENMINVSFDINSSTHSKGQLYYAKLNESFHDSNMIRFHVKEGTSKIHFSIYSKTNKIRLDPISAIGKISIKNLKISTITNLKNNFISLKINSFRDDHILGTINTLHKGIVLFQIPFDKGWDIYMDGQKSEIQVVNFGLMGIEVPVGKHHIELKYTPEGMKLGILLTLIGLILLIFFTLFIQKKSAKK